MKDYSIYIILFFFSLNLSGQSEAIIDNEKKLAISHTMGVNIKSLVGLSDWGFFVSDPTPYILNYQLGIGDLGLRISYGGQFNNSTRDISTVEIADHKSRDNHFRFGINQNVVQRKRFKLKLGIDGVFHDYLNLNENNPNGSNPVKFETIGSEVGFGPTMMIEYSINDWISVATEAWYYLIYEDQTYKRVQDSVSTVETSKGWKSELYQPSVIYLNVKF